MFEPAVIRFKVIAARTASSSLRMLLLLYVMLLVGSVERLQLPVFVHLGMRPGANPLQEGWILSLIHI